jgi:hypothetical protein
MWWIEVIEVPEVMMMEEVILDMSDSTYMKAPPLT